MKAILTWFIIIFIGLTNCFADEMPNETIKSCYYQSYLHESQKRYADAISDLKAVYLKYPNTYTINYRLGWLYYLNQNFANAITHLNQATAVFPQSAETIKVLILIYQAQENWVEVETLAVQLLKRSYYSIDGNYWYAIALKMQGKYALAIKIVNKMLAIQPTSEIFLQELGENLFLCEYIDDSKSLYTNMLILYPHNRIAQSYLNKIDTLKQKEADTTMNKNEAHVQNHFNLHK